MKGFFVNSRLTRNLAVSESGFLFLPTTGETFTVNEPGRIVLAALQGAQSEEEIVARLTAEYDADAASIRRDLEDFLVQLRQYQLLSEA
jgi:PqqD family protein of HPr-rel-A system